MEAEQLKEVIRSYNKPKKIAVCTTWGSPFTWTVPAYNMANLIRPEGVDVLYLPGHGWCPARRHMYGIERALEWGASHICFLGPDQLHPFDILLKFTKHLMDGWPAVAARVPIRGWGKLQEKPFTKMAWKWRFPDDPKRRTFTLNDLTEVDPKDGDLQEIAVVGSGALIFDVACLKSMKKPWFYERMRKNDQEMYEAYDRLPIMDTTFCYRLATEGTARILCDLTINAKHIDAFAIDETYGDRFPDWPKDDKHTVLFRGELPGTI